MIVVDASVLTGFLLGQPRAVEAVLDALAGCEDEPLHAPALIEPEILNALRGLARSGRLSGQRAREVVNDLANTRMIRYPHGLLRERVWELRHDLTAYDATYLALAEALEDSVLLTADAGLADRARRSIGARRVRQIEAHG